MRKRTIDRRSFLKYVGAGAGALAGGLPLGSLLGCAPARSPADVAAGAWTDADGTPLWSPPPYPVPLPGDPGPAAVDAERLATYEVRDALVLPPGFRYDLLARWGDRFGAPGHEVDFGYDNDYTGLVPIPAEERLDPEADEHWLLVNHEYVDFRSWIASQREDGHDWPAVRIHADRDDPPRFAYGILEIDGWRAPEGNDAPLEGELAPPAAVRETMRRFSDAGLAAQGVSVLRVRRDPASGRFEVVADAVDHRRIATQSVQNLSADAPPFRFTGPAAELLEGAPRGTFCNCSGGTTPWGTFLTCEENTQYQTDEEIAPDGGLLPERKPAFGARGERVNGRVVEARREPMSLTGMGHAASEPLDGRHYQWVAEIDPRTGALAKHTMLGRFRHENVAVRAEAGKRLAAYLGDDRRGGHVWKFVSERAVDDPADPANSALLERGTLYVARFAPDFTGRWISLAPETPLRRPEPEHCPSGHVRVPARTVEAGGGHVAIGDTALEEPEIEVAQWQRSVERFAGKPFAECTLGDLVRPAPTGDPAPDPVRDRERRLGVILMDAFAMANAVGGTPTARPEDLEVHPLDHCVYIAFTDATDAWEGSPDTRVFPDAERKNSRQYGAIYRLIEDGDDPASETFRWGRFVSSGEVAERGGGFANADNLAFDPEGNLWLVTDITTTAHNFPTRREAIDGTLPGGKQFPGVFGNNAMFMIPTRGPSAGVPHLFAIGPSECELTGPTFSADGRTLILSVQHPGELRGTRSAERPSKVERYVVHDRDDRPFVQEREVPIGSNFPSGELGRAPRPCVVCITREG